MAVERYIDQINDLRTIKELEQELLKISLERRDAVKTIAKLEKDVKKGIQGSAQQLETAEGLHSDILDIEVKIKNTLGDINKKENQRADIIRSVAGEIQKTENTFLGINKLNDSGVKSIARMNEEVLSSKEYTIAQKEAAFGFLDSQSKIAQIQQELADMGEMDSHTYFKKLDTMNSLTAQSAEFAKTLGAMGESGASLANRFGEMYNHNQKVNNVLKLNAILTEDQKADVEHIAHSIHKWKDRFMMVKDMAKSFLSTPQAAMGGLLIGAGFLYKKFYELGHEIGVGANQMLGFKSTMAVSEIFMSGSADAAKELAKQMGDVNEVSIGAAMKTGFIAYKLNIGTAEAAGLVNMFGKFQGQTAEAGADMAYAMQHLAAMNGVMPTEVAKDLAKASLDFATFTSHGGANMIKAAVQAAKLGVSVSDTAKMARGLLNFEESINAEMEASTMLGKEINFSRARELAFQNDIEGATKEMLRQVGGINEFNKMNVFQREALAKAMGTEVDKLEQMLANQENAQTLNGELHGSFSAIGGMITKAVGHLGEFLMYLGGGVIVLGQMKMSMPGLYNSIARVASGVWGAVQGLGSFLAGTVRTAATWMGNLVPAVGGMVRTLWNGTGALFSYITAPLKMLANWVMSTKIMQGTIGFFQKAGQAIKGGFQAGAAKIGGGVASKIGGGVAEKAAPTAGAGGAGKAVEGTKGFSSINPASLIKGAVAMLIMAGALFVMGKALQQFSGLNWGTIAMAGVSLVGLGLIMAGFGYLSAFIYAGALALAASSIALMLFGVAINVVAMGFNLFVQGLTSLASILPTIGANLGTLVTMVLPIFGLAAALVALAAALTMIAASGPMALPILMGLGIMAGAAGMLFGGGEKGESEDSLLTEIQGLRADLKAGLISVNMDGTNVSRKVFKTAQNQTAGKK